MTHLCVCICHIPLFMLGTVICVQVEYRSGDYVDEFGKHNVVFLAAESANILNGLYLFLFRKKSRCHIIHLKMITLTTAITEFYVT